MSSKKVIAICQSGGEFTTEDDGSISYKGGEAYAVDLDEQSKVSDFKEELADAFNCSISSMSIKYFLPGNKKNLITISKDKDLKRLVNYYKDSDQVEVFILAVEGGTGNASIVPVTGSRYSVEGGTGNASIIPVSGSRTMVAEAMGIPAAPLNIMYNNGAIDEAPGSNDDIHGKAAINWDDAITGVGQTFTSYAEFLDTLRKYSVTHGFAYSYKKKDSHRVVVKCKAEGCLWYLSASRLPSTQLICIKKMVAKHTCEGSANKASYRATRGWVESVIKDKLKASPWYTPKEIANDIKKQYGIQLSYSRARRAKESVREQLQGSYQDAYSQLPFFCQKIMETNPGSVATLTTKEDLSFHRLFVSFHASLRGFQEGCRPLLFLSTTPVNSKYQAILFAATAIDGNDGAFPVAFAIVDEETDVNWRWFLSELKSALSATQQITFVADFQRGLKQSLFDIFGQQCYHGYCLRYLVEKLNNDLKVQFSHEARQILVEDLYAAANAPKIEAFERVMENIKAISPEAYNWFIESEPEHWANVFFGGARYNHMKSDFGQDFYSWMAKANEFTIIHMVNMIRGKLMELIYARRSNSTQLTIRLVPCMEGKLQSEIAKAHQLQVFLKHGSTYEVHGKSVDIVDVDHWDCSCKVWQLTGLPCCHAIACFRCLGRSPYDYCSRYFTVENYRLIYAESINPVPDVEKPENGELVLIPVAVTPPLNKRLAGRPKMIHAGPADSISRQMRCSKCKKLGHNKRSCREGVVQGEGGSEVEGEDEGEIEVEIAVEAVGVPELEAMEAE